MPEERIQKNIDDVHKRVDRHDTRIQLLEQNIHALDKIMALTVNRLDTMIALITSISNTIRNGVLGVLIGAVLWVLAQMGGIV